MAVVIAIEFSLRKKGRDYNRGKPLFQAIFCTYDHSKCLRKQPLGLEASIVMHFTQSKKAAFDRINPDLRHWFEGHVGQNQSVTQSLGVRFAKEDLHKYTEGESLVIPEIQQVSSKSWPRELKCRSRVHYYLADRSKPIAFFWEPQEEARFRAVQRALRGLRLGEANTAVADGRVRDQTTGKAFVYEPHRLVIPVSARLKDSPFTTAYWERVREFTGQCAFELVVESSD